MKNGIPICEKCLNYNANSIVDFEKKKTKISPEVSEIIPKKLYLGNYDTAKSKETLEKHKISHILTCGKYMEKHFEDNFNYLQLDLEDIIEENIIRYFDITYKYIDSGETVYVHCNAGVSRSPSIVIAYLMKKEKMTFIEAFNKVKACRECVFPNESFVEQLKKFEETIFEKKDNILYCD